MDSERTEENAVEQELMASPPIQLEDRHVCCCAAYVEKEADCGDGNVCRLLWLAAQRPELGWVRCLVAHLGNVRKAPVDSVQVIPWKKISCVRLIYKIPLM
jgi:hypothetical protein